MSDPYTELATEVREHPEVMTELSDWFDSDQPKSSYPFGQALGKVDEVAAVGSKVAEWLASGRCLSLVTGYLRGVVDRSGTLPEQWIHRLDEASQRHPEYVARVSLTVDASPRGFQRVLNLVASSNLDSHLLYNFAFDPWPAILSPQDKLTILRLLEERCKVDPSQATVTALRLMAFWSNHGKTAQPDLLDQQLMLFARRSLGLAVDGSDWLAVVELLASSRPRDAAELLIDALTASWSSAVMIEEFALNLLIEIARQRSEIVMEEIGKRILDKQRRDFFRIRPFRGLFEAIGLSALQKWVEAHGAENLKYIANHLESPGLDSQGEPVVPAITQWLFREHEHDDRAFRAFCCGRHGLELREGYARDRRNQIEKCVAPFLNHPLRRVREWARYELDSNERDAELDDLMDERCERC